VSDVQISRLQGRLLNITEPKIKREYLENQFAEIQTKVNHSEYG